MDVQRAIYLLNTQFEYYDSEKEIIKIFNKKKDLQMLFNYFKHNNNSEIVDRVINIFLYHIEISRPIILEFIDDEIDVYFKDQLYWFLSNCK